MELLQMELEFWLDDLEEADFQSLVDFARGTNLAKRMAECEENSSHSLMDEETHRSPIQLSAPKYG